MIRAIIKLFTSVVGLISLLMSLCTIILVVWLFSHVFNTPSPMDMVNNYGTKTVSCMVDKSWGSLSPDDKAKWNSTHDLTQLGSDALKTIKDNAGQCTSS